MAAGPARPARSREGGFLAWYLGFVLLAGYAPDFSSIFLVLISPKVWPGADAEDGLFGFYDLANPGIISIPLGFLACWAGTMLSTEHGNERSFHELYVRSETELGAEEAPPTGESAREHVPVIA